MDNSIRDANKESVNVMFRGTYPLSSYGKNHDRLYTIFNESLRRQFILNMSSNKRMAGSTLNPKHSVTRSAFVQGQWLTAECSNLSETMHDATDVEKLIIRQAKEWMNVSDFTVINVDISHPFGEHYAWALAKMTGGTIVRNWLNEDTHSFRSSPLIGEKLGEPGQGIDALVMPRGWTRLDAMALLHHVASQDAPPNIQFSVSNDAGIEGSVMELKLKPNTGIAIIDDSDETASARFTIMGDTDISILTSRGRRVERDILKSVATISGGQHALRLPTLLDSENDPISDTFILDVSGMGVEDEKIPKLTNERVKILRSMASLNGLQSVISSDDRSNVSLMFDEIIDSLAVKSSLKSQNEQEIESRRKHQTHRDNREM